MILTLFDPPSDFEQRVHDILPEEEVVSASRDDREKYADVVPQAEVIVGRPYRDDLDRAERLRWLQLSSAGSDNYVHSLRADVVLTSANGVYGVPASEHAIAMMLAFVRRLPTCVRAAQSKRWEALLEGDELYGRTAAVLGLGDIGSAIARRLKAFGMHVLALRRRPGHPPHEYVDAVYGRDGLYELLAAADHVVNALPYTENTHHLIDAAALKRMKPTAYIYNVGRGSTIDEKAMIHALQNGELAGAGLDVFEEEPLPEESPLWEMENVVITPHRGGSSPREDERVAELFLENLRRRAHGEELLNVVDRELGY